jgi:hypothetical protein
MAFLLLERKLGVFNSEAHFSGTFAHLFFESAFMPFMILKLVLLNWIQ